MHLSRLRIRSYPQRVPTSWRTLALALLAMTLAVMVMPATFADPPARVARLSVLSGEVGFAPIGDDTWREASLNRPLITGDRLYTESDARTELDLGSASLRLDARSELQLRTLDDQTAQFDLTEGTLNLTVRKLYEGQRYEIGTPTLALVVHEPGAYRVDVRNGATQVTVFEGNAEVYGENDAYQRVTARQSYRFPNASLRDSEVFDLPRPDNFDDWCFARDERYRQPVAQQYVSDEVVGYADLDDYGDWHDESDYGPVWYPRRMGSGWAPYRGSHNYLHTVNITDIHNHTSVNNTIINNVYNNHPGSQPTRGMRHTHRNNPTAVTAVKRDTFDTSPHMRPNRSLKHDVIMHRQPAHNAKVNKPRPSEQRVQTKVQPHKHAQEPRRAKPIPASSPTHSERNRYTAAPTEPRRDYRQTRQNERPPRQALISTPRQSAIPTAREDAAKNPRSKTRERQRGKQADTRQGMARGSESVMMMR